MVTQKIKSKKGLSINFLILNTLGYICYTLYNAYGLIYSARYSPQVHLSDLLISLFSLSLLTFSITIWIIYPKNKNHPELFWNLFVVASLASIICYWIFFADNIEDLFEFLGMQKVFLTIVKYCPQVYHIWVKRSTWGFSIWYVNLDMIGSVCNTLQIVVDIENDKIGMNYAKFGLGFVGIFFDSIFMFQHHVLYGGSQPADEDDDNETVEDQILVKFEN